MRPAIAVVLPQWVQDSKKQQKPGTRALYQVLPSLMQWHTYEFTEDWLITHTVNSGAKIQLEGVMQHIQQLLTRVSGTNLLVARISLSAYIPDQLILTVEPREGMKITSSVVLRTNKDGLIEGVVRVFDDLPTDAVKVIP